MQMNAMTSVVVLIAVDPTDQAEAAFNCEFSRYLNTPRTVHLPIK